MRIQQFDYFLTASRVLNFAKAAKVYYMTPQTFINQIRALEKDLGVRLFTHENDAWALTDAGRVLQEHLPTIKASLDNMVEEVRNAAEGFESRLSITSLDGLIFTESYMEAIRQLCHDNPKLHIKASRSSYKGVRRALDNDLADAVVTLSYDIKNRADCDKMILEQTKAAIAVPLHHRLAAQDAVTMKDLDGIDLYVPGDLSITPEELLCELFENDIHPFVYPMRNSSESVLNVEMGLGASLLCQDTILKGNPYLAIRPIEDMCGYEVALYWKKSNDKKILREFIALLS